MTTFSGQAGVATYVAITLKHGIKLYRDTGIKPNRAWTPTAMLAKAGEITGQTFKRGQFTQAIDALDAWIAKNGTRGEERRA